jgi:hypothetical protein
MAKAVTALIPAIEEAEREAAALPSPMEDVFLLGIPMPTYKAMSDAATKRNMTFAQLLSRGLHLALTESEDLHG